MDQFVDAWVAMCQHVTHSLSRYYESAVSDMAWAPTLVWTRGDLLRFGLIDDVFLTSEIKKTVARVFCVQDSGRPHSWLDAVIDRFLLKICMITRAYADRTSGALFMKLTDLCYLQSLVASETLTFWGHPSQVVLKSQHKGVVCDVMASELICVDGRVYTPTELRSICLEFCVTNYLRTDPLPDDVLRYIFNLLRKPFNL